MVGGLRDRARIVLRAVLTPEAVLALAAPPLTCALLAWSGALAWEDVVAARSVRIWSGLALSALVLLGIRWIVARRLAPALGAGAALALAAFGTGSLAPRLDATADVGVGEEGFAWRVTRAPAGLRPPDVAVLEVPETAGLPVRLSVAGQEILAAPGRTVAGPGGLVVTAEPYAAPFFSVRRATGSVEGEGFLKLVPGDRDYFQVALLPHRFYASVPSPAPDAPVATPARIHLRIQRGKLRVLDQDVALQEAVRFEGLSIRFDPGVRWARVRLRAAPPRWALGAAIVLALSAFAAGWRARSRSA